MAGRKALSHNVLRNVEVAFEGIEFSRYSGVISMLRESSTGISGTSTALTSERIESQQTRGKNPDALQELRGPEDHALGRSRGGFSTKIHLVTDGGGLPLGAEISAGQATEPSFASDSALVTGSDPATLHDSRYSASCASSAGSVSVCSESQLASARRIARRLHVDSSR